MALTKNVSYTGQQNVSTFNGKIQLDEMRGRLVVRNADGTIQTQQDVEGFKVNGISGEELVRIDQYGFSMNDGSNDRIIIGNEPGGF